MEEDYPGPSDLFSSEDVYKILALVNEVLSEVNYYYWVNKAQSEYFEVLDWIEFKFKSGNHLFLTAGLDSDGIKIAEPDFDLITTNLRDEFKGAVSIDKREATKFKIWKNNIGKDITPSLIKHEKGILNDQIVLKFLGGDDIIIFLGIEGLEVDYFHESD